MKRIFGAALFALCLTSCFSGVEDEDAGLAVESPPLQEEEEAPAETGSTPAAPDGIDTSFDTELRVGGDLLNLPQEKQFKPSSAAVSEDEEPSVITRPPLAE